MLGEECGVLGVENRVLDVECGVLGAECRVPGHGASHGATMAW